MKAKLNSTLAAENCAVDGGVVGNRGCFSGQSVPGNTVACEQKTGLLRNLAYDL